MKLKQNKLFLSIVPVLSFAFLATVLGVSVASPVHDTSATDPTTITFNVIRPAFMLTLSVSPTVTLDIEPTPTGTMTVASSVVSAATTSPSGYTLYLEMTGTNATSNSLIHSTNDNFELTSSGTFTNPVALTDGTWGYAIEHEAESVYNINGFDASYATMESANPTSAKFAAVPTSNSPAQRIAETDEVGGVDVTVYYGVRADYETASGAYTNKVLYTAIADDGATPVMIVSPNSLSGLAGESVSLVTSMYTTADIDTDAYILTRAQYNAVVGGTLDITTLTSQKMTCSRDTTSDPFALNCTTVAAADGAGYIYLDIPRYGTHFATPVAINAPEFFTISSMQEMTPAVCDSVATPSTRATSIVNIDNLYDYTGTGAEVPEVTLTDMRGSQPYESYRVRKFADGNCWMTENLRLELSAGDTLYPSDTDVAVSTVVGMDTQPYDQPSDNRYDWGVADASGLNQSTVDRWLSRSTKVNGTWATETNPSQSGASSINLTGENQKQGVYYNWYTATAGTGTWDITADGVNANSSICPKGWELPRYDGNGSWMNLIRDVYGVIANPGEQPSADANTKLHAMPFSMPLSGDINWQTGAYTNQGTYGRFWSAGSENQSSSYAMLLKDSDNRVDPNSGNRRLRGFNVRCIAKDFWNITNMQQMTPEIVASVATPSTSASSAVTTKAGYEALSDKTSNVPQRTLSDIRDGETYTVRKLADGNVWMTENLRLVGSFQPDQSDSDVTWVKGTDTFTLPAQNTGTWCTTNDAACIDTANHVSTGDSTYGTYYNWYAATAGTGTYSTTNIAVAASSICPKGWRLPTSRNNGDFNALYSKYNSSALMQGIPGFILSGVRVGYGNISQGTEGRYWSSIAGNNEYAYLSKITESDFSPTYSALKTLGATIRCLAK